MGPVVKFEMNGVGKEFTPGYICDRIYFIKLLIEPGFDVYSGACWFFVTFGDVIMQLSWTFRLQLPRKVHLTD